MSTSVGVNVLRWSALATGLFYGAYTQLSLSARDKVHAEHQAYTHKESLIRQAKAEWAKTHAPEQKPSAAKADAKNPDADLNVVLGIADN